MVDYEQRCDILAERSTVVRTVVKPHIRRFCYFYRRSGCQKEARHRGLVWSSYRDDGFKVLNHDLTMRPIWCLVLTLKRCRQYHLTKANAMVSRKGRCPAFRGDCSQSLVDVTQVQPYEMLSGYCRLSAPRQMTEARTQGRTAPA